VSEEGVSASHCAGENAGCVIQNAESDACVENVGTCEDGFEEGYCEGDFLFLGCTLGQPFAFDCSGFSGRCEGSNCIVVVDGPCDDELLVCDEGLSCIGLTEESRGTCRAE
ncbi:MAG: hypothetical protein VYD19_01570, partial [Myxococcota bacterium]|nr:hypothetical protein [Myxococcota bacterium]